MVKISECEEQIMIVIWTCDIDPCMKSIRVEANSRFGHEWAPQTVSTFLSRLVKKGFLTSEKKGLYTYYTPAVSKEQYVKEKLQDLAEMYFGEDASVLIDYIGNTR